MEWTKENVIIRLKEINRKGYISVPGDMYRTDDGIVGQILEREFDVQENNLHLADLGTFELKGMRKRKGKTCLLTLFHQTSSSGMTPIEIFNRFGYVRMSSRSNILKKKLFTTIRGDKVNSLGLILKPKGTEMVDLFYHNEYLATWDLSSCKTKIQKVILAFANTQGKTNSPDETFYFNEAYLLAHPNNIANAISSGAIVMDLCIDQPADGSKAAHDRGPHIRISVKKLSSLFEIVEQIL